MPIYEYDCNECGRRFDLFYKSISEDSSSAVCPECGSENTEKVFSVFASSVKSEANARNVPAACPVGGG